MADYANCINSGRVDILNFSANLSHLWADLPWSDRFDAAAAAGFTAVEALFPYDSPASETREALNRNNLRFLLLNAPPPNYTGGERGFAAIPGLEGRFSYDMRRVFRYATALGADFIHVMTGVAEGAEARATLVSNLKLACESAPDGITLTLEPLNQGDMPGYFLSDFDLAADVIAEVNAPNLALQYDSYHAQVITGDARQTFARHLSIIRHIQIGDAPGRVPPGMGEIDFDALFADIDASGYDGWISAEYTPGTMTEKTLGWMKART